MKLLLQSLKKYRLIIHNSLSLNNNFQWLENRSTIISRIIAMFDF